MRENSKQYVIRLTALTCAAAVGLMGSSWASAQTWDAGGGTNNSWTQPTNWVGNIAPANDGTADIVFDTDFNANQSDINIAFDINTLTVEGTAGGIVGGVGLTIQNGVIANGPGTNFSVPITLGNSQTWAFTTFTGGIWGSIDTNGNDLTLDGNNFFGPLATMGTITGTGSVTYTAAC